MYIMKHLKVAEARARFGEMLDQAEKGAPVVIERRGVRFRLTAEPARAVAKSRTALFDYIDAGVLSGQWTWTSRANGLAFAARRKAR